MPSSDPLFSVVMPTFNRPRLLAEALRSLLAQTVDDFECIVVNDGHVPVELPDDERFHLIDGRGGRGPAAAMNVALDRARGTFVTFLDDDDAYVPRRLDLGLAGVRRAPLAICWRANHATGVPGRNRRLEGWVNDVILDSSPPFLGQATIVRSRAPRFDERLRHAVDVEWWIRCTREVPVTTVPQVGFLFRRHEGRQSTNAELRFVNRLLIYELHRDYFERYPRAAARFHRRTGGFARDAGRHEEARMHFSAAFRLEKTPRAAYRWARQIGRTQEQPAAGSRI